MNRQDFFKILAESKIQSGKSTNTLSFDLRMQWSTLRRFEKGTSNSNLRKIFEYLSAINSILVINRLNIVDYDQLIDWLISARQGCFSQRQLAEEIGMSYVMIARIESKKSDLTIDVLLKIIEHLGYNIEIKPL